MNNISFKQTGFILNGRNVILQFPREEQDVSQIRQEIKDILVCELRSRLRQAAQCERDDTAFRQSGKHLRI